MHLKINSSAVTDLKVKCDAVDFTFAAPNYVIDSCGGNLTVKNETAGVVLYNATITDSTLSILDLQTCVLEFTKGETTIMTIKSTAFGLYSECGSTTCYYAVPISVNADFNVSYDGLTTVMNYVNSTP